MRHFSSGLKKYPFLKELGLKAKNSGVYHSGEHHMGGGKSVQSINPATGEEILAVRMGNALDYDNCVSSMESERKKWMTLPMPARGEIVRQLG
jgi:acyl-CoA reductase-like NAD-dependent aldehyde dehydrogenase